MCKHSTNTNIIKKQPTVDESREISLKPNRMPPWLSGTASVL